MSELAGATLTRVRALVTGSRDVPPPQPELAQRIVADLFAQHRVGLTRLAVLLVDDEASAQDVVQEAFLGLYEHWNRLKDPASAVDYLRSAVLNTSRSVLRRRRTARGYVPRHESPARSAESLALMRAEHRDVLQALATIGDRQREVLVLRYWAGLSEDEIARSTGLSRGAVKSTASRGIDALEKQLRGVAGFGAPAAFGNRNGAR